MKKLPNVLFLGLLCLNPLISVNYAQTGVLPGLNSSLYDHTTPLDLPCSPHNATSILDGLSKLSGSQMQRQPLAFTGTIIVAGITGDLGKKRLIPALYELVSEGMEGQIIGVGKSETTVATILENARPFIQNYDEHRGQLLVSRIHYQRLQSGDQDFKTVRKLIQARESECMANKKAHCTQRIVYLAVPTDSFSDLTQSMVDNGIIERDNPEHVIIYEKPFGWDARSAAVMSTTLKSLLSEDQLYIIDHYLAKKLVSLIPQVQEAFGIPWNNQSIKEVSVFFDEAVDIEQRGTFYDRCGAVRDVVQNHILQLLALVGTPNHSINPQELQHAKAHFIQALIPVEGVAGQYEGYISEPGVKADSSTETYVELKAYSQLYHWQGVPFFIRAGKALTRKSTEIHITFTTCPSMVLILRVSPKEEVILEVLPEYGGSCDTYSNTNGAHAYKVVAQDAFKTVLQDIMQKIRSSTVSLEEINAQWSFEEKSRKLLQEQPLFTYKKGSLPLHNKQ
jgi:glucose-6-phosphate 1-dehydrogenase